MVLQNLPSKALNILGFVSVKTRRMNEAFQFAQGSPYIIFKGRTGLEQSGRGLVYHLIRALCTEDDRYTEFVGLRIMERAGNRPEFLSEPVIGFLNEGLFFRAQRARTLISCPYFFIRDFTPMRLRVFSIRAEIRRVT